MKRIVSNPKSLTESPGSCKWVRIRLPNQDSELHIGLSQDVLTFTVLTGREQFFQKSRKLGRDCVTGAPVIELQYKHEFHAVLEKVLMVTSGQTGVVPRHVNFVPKTIVLEVGFFYLRLIRNLAS